MRMTNSKVNVELCPSQRLGFKSTHDSAKREKKVAEVARVAQKGKRETRNEKAQRGSDAARKYSGFSRGGMRSHRPSKRKKIFSKRKPRLCSRVEKEAFFLFFCFFCFVVFCFLCLLYLLCIPKYSRWVVYGVGEVCLVSSG